jgi:hypothetical protein
MQLLLGPKPLDLDSWDRYSVVSCVCSDSASLIDKCMVVMFRQCNRRQVSSSLVKTLDFSTRIGISLRMMVLIEFAGLDLVLFPHGTYWVAQEHQVGLIVVDRSLHSLESISQPRMCFLRCGCVNIRLHRLAMLDIANGNVR